MPEGWAGGGRGHKTNWRQCARRAAFVFRPTQGPTFGWNQTKHEMPFDVQPSSQMKMIGSISFSMSSQPADDRRPRDRTKKKLLAPPHNGLGRSSIDSLRWRNENNETGSGSQRANQRVRFGVRHRRPAAIDEAGNRNEPRMNERSNKKATLPSSRPRNTRVGFKLNWWLRPRPIESSR